MDCLIDRCHKIDTSLSVANKISLCSERLGEIEKLYNNITMHVSLSSYTNFRDAFTHYKKAYETSYEIYFYELNLAKQK